MLTLRTDGNAAVHLQGNSVEFLRGTVNVTQPADLFYMFTGRAVWGGQPCLASVSVYTDLTPDVFFTAVNLNDTTNSALIVQGSVPVPGPRGVTVWAVAAGAPNCHIFVAEPALTLMGVGELAHAIVDGSFHPDAKLLHRDFDIGHATQLISQRAGLVSPWNATVDPHAAPLHEHPRARSAGWRGLRFA
jgi:hypothetical protein